MAEASAERPAGDKAARSAERARTNRLSRLPFLYDFALRGRTQAVLATLPQAALALVLALEGLHLNRRLAKDEVAGRTVYGG